MYTTKDLEKYEYFNGSDIIFLLDSLTGVISRQYILDFIKNLVETPAMCMMDLDNLHILMIIMDIKLEIFV